MKIVLSRQTIYRAVLLYLGAAMCGAVLGIGVVAGISLAADRQGDRPKPTITHIQLSDNAANPQPGIFEPRAVDRCDALGIDPGSQEILEAYVMCVRE